MRHAQVAYRLKGKPKYGHLEEIQLSKNERKCGV